ncbi:MAG TPA: DUF5054 domain-containing protein [Anaerolineae bacterium]|nr:DUF5054 domain-containing protein [Anaerolineae bacterium]
MRKTIKSKLQNSSIQRVHLIFKTHLDLGFTDFSRNVAALYFERYIPHAIGLARELRRAGGAERFVWTTGSWLIYEALERASHAERAELEQAILQGDLAWHGLPFTTHSELMDVDLFRFGLSLSQELDARFGKKTITAKMTDVPGHTRGIVPLLAEAGIQFLHIGVNPASTPPDVPSVFVWRAPDGSDVMVMYQKGAYGDLQIVPGLKEAIAFAHTNDNEAPQTVEAVRAAYTKLRDQFPDAEIVASTLDAFAQVLRKVKAQLPIVTQEMGDTWIHGAASDPKKISQFRKLLRLRHVWLERESIAPDSSEFRNFNRALLLVPEHTWGLDVKTHLADSENFSRELFDAARDQPNFQKMEASWQEQRAYIEQAVHALDDSPLQRDASSALRSLEPVRPDTATITRIAKPLTRFETEHWRFKFDARGALVRLEDKASGRNWASADHPLGLFCYQTFSQADYDRFYKQYIHYTPENEWWSVPDFTKPGMASARAQHRDWCPRLAALYHESNSPSFLLELALPKAAIGKYGCPASVFVNVEFPEEEPSIHFVVQWFDKRATRLPEAIWFSFCPRVKTGKGWTMDKLGQVVSPLDVVRDGNRHLHAVGHGVQYQEKAVRLEIESRDTPLVAPGERSLLHFNNRQPSLTCGMHFLLYDNVWGTNFPMWYDEPARFEFIWRTSVNVEKMV